MGPTRYGSIRDGNRVGPYQWEKVMQRLVIAIEGGMVSSVCTRDESLLGVAVTLIDYDTDGIEPDRLTDVLQPDGSSVRALIQDTEVEWNQLGHA